MSFDESSGVLYIGFDQGKLVRLRIDENVMQYTELPEIGPHTLRLNGISINTEANSFMSVSDDGSFKTTDNESG